MNTHQNTMPESVKDFVKNVNEMRVANKNNWFAYTSRVEGKQVQIKAYNTWAQIFKVDGIDYAGAMDLNVKQFKALLNEPFNTSN